MTIMLDAVPNMPQFVEGDDLGEVICSKLLQHGMKLMEGDIVCVASKVVSICEGRKQSLLTVEVSGLALEIHQRVPRKDPRIIQLMIDESRDETGARLEVADNWIGCWLPNGLMLTSAGIDKVNEDDVILLPKNPDLSAKKISDTIYEKLGVRVGIVITDSDGRIDKKGATQIAIGVYGVPTLRNKETYDDQTKTIKKTSETLCDLIAASAGLIMGQRGTNKPVVILRGLNYEFDEESRIDDALYRTFKSN